jgi:hypothetical protein
MRDLEMSADNAVFVLINKGPEYRVEEARLSSLEEGYGETFKDCEVWRDAGEAFAAAVDLYGKAECEYGIVPLNYESVEFGSML